MAVRPGVSDQTVGNCAHHRHAESRVFELQLHEQLLINLVDLRIFGTARGRPARRLGDKRSHLAKDVTRRELDVMFLDVHLTGRQTVEAAT
ncbi:hypothetical protein [uncultured Roseobacter sp.]|uniref:hypothetical protein n=1 Tax=uncultured Roseobacter sp. TaxID=114847 RepID=UPI00260287CF|nr:hypothetical protein [uncultured Roseobacter sp.]